MSWTTVGVTFLAVCAVAGCVQRSGDGVGQAGSSTASRPPAPTTTDTTRFVCPSVDTAAYRQLLRMAFALAGDEEGSALRASVAATYRDFAESLDVIVPTAAGNLRTALTDWSSASDQVAVFVATTEPGPDLVIDFGPAHPRWLAAQSAAEKECGQPLPNTK